jgi:hypothetical protein
MITCPWCGTSYQSFQPNCTNCGGPLPGIDQQAAQADAGEEPAMPPPAPRPISQRYIFRLMSSDGWSIAGFIFALLGFIFGVVGAGLTLGIVTAFVGIPFLLLGILFLGFGGAALVWRYQAARQVLTVLREGEATRGEILDLQENYSVTVNGRHPWVIQYGFQANGEKYAGKVTTLNQPGQGMQPGKAVCILYLPSSPKWSSIYPHP